MTNKEAIEILEKDGWGYPENMHTEAVMMAIDALEKRSEAEEYRTPKKVKIISPEPRWKFYHCPNCGTELSIYYQSYCIKCGQALDWSEVEE